MKVAVINDQHFGVRGDSPLFLDYFEKFYNTVFFPELDARGIDTVLGLGDVFDRRKHTGSATLLRARKMFFDQLHERNITVHSIVGNHDTAFKNTNEVNTPSLVLRDYPNYHVYDDRPVELQLGSCLVMLSPWICDSNLESSSSQDSR